MRRMKEDDVPWALDLLNSEGWAYEKEDVRRFLRIEPDGCLVAENDWKPVGFATAFTMGKRGVIGNIVVEESERRRGVGTALVGTALAHLAASGAKEVRLFSYHHQVGFYEKLGFRAGGEVRTFKGRTPEACVKPGIRAMGEEDLKSVLELDARFSGADRSAWLTATYRDFPGLAFVSGAGSEITGYVFGRGSGVAGYEAGPCMSAEGAPMPLLLALFSGIGVGSEVWLSVPVDKSALLESLAWLGFGEAFSTREMNKGAPLPELRSAACAIGGLEFG